MSTQSSPASGRLPRPLVLLLGLAAAVVSVAGISEIGGIVSPSLVALVLVLTLDPLRASVIRRGAPAWLGVTALLVAAYAILLALVAALAFSAGQLGALLPGYSTQFQDLAARVAGVLEPLGVTREQVGAAIESIDLSSLLSGVRPLVGGVTSAVSSLLIVVVLVLFLGIESASFGERLDRAAVSPELVAALAVFARRTRRYVVVSTVFGLVVAVVDVAVLYWLSVPLPVVWGLLAFVTNYIPNIGFVLGLGPPALFALLEGGVGPMIAVVVAYSVANFVIQSLVQPKVVGDAVGLSATVTVLSVIFWAVVLGPLGGLLAIPLTLLVKAVFVDADPGARWIGRLIGDQSSTGGGTARAGGQE